MIEKSKVDPKGTCFNCLKDIEACVCNRSNPGVQAPVSPDQSISRSTRTYGTQIGDVIDGKYEIIGLIGAGGMGKVFKAKHLRIDRFYAIKVLKDDIAEDANYRGRFEQEARAASRLADAHLVPVFDYGMTRAGEPYIVMDFVNGRSLESLIKNNRPLDAKLAVQAFIQICEGLEHAHSVGIIHRDLKPSNVMLSDSNTKAPQARVLDFGIAKLTDQGHTTSQSLTKTGDVFGSPQYMSPEQCMGKKADRRSDIYSLGCLMFEVLTGYPPFHADNPLATMFQHVNEMPPPFAKVCPDVEVPLALQKIVLQTLAKKPEERYQTMEEVRAALTELSPLKNPTTTPTAKPTSKQNVGIAIGITATIISLVLAGLYFSHRAPVKDADQAAKQNSPTTTESVKSEESLKPLSTPQKTIATAVSEGPKSSKGSEKKGEEKKPNKISEDSTAAKDKQDATKLASLSAPPKGITAEAHYEQACHYIKARNYSKAIASLTEAIKLNPNNIEYYRQRAFCYADSKKYRQALNDYDRMVELNGQDSVTYIRRANALIMLNRSQEALSDLDTAARLSGKKDVIAALKGRAYHELRQYPQACFNFRSAIWEGLKEYSNYQMLGEDLWALNKKGEALLTAQKARQIDPKNPWSYLFCAKIFEADKDYKSAISELQKAPPTYEPYRTEISTKLRQDLALSSLAAPSKTSPEPARHFSTSRRRLVKVNPFLWERR